MRYLNFFPIWNHRIAPSCFQLVKFIKTRAYLSAQFRLTVPPTTAIARLNQNAIVSLNNDTITKEKVEVNIRTNPHTLFLTATNRAANLLNLMAIDVLFSTQLPLANVLDGKINSMNVYKHTLVVFMQSM